MKKLLAFSIALLLSLPLTALAAVPVCHDFGEFRITFPAGFVDASEAFDMPVFASNDASLLFCPVYQEGDTSMLTMGTDEETFQCIQDTLLAPSARVCTRLAAEKSGGCYKVACVMVSETNGFAVAAVSDTGVFVGFIDLSGTDSLEFAQYLVKSIFVTE